jgi:hypothetical protein
MYKYKYNIFLQGDFNLPSITTTVDKENFVIFPAEAGNPAYEDFLRQAKLTDEQVHELTPDTWHDFPEATE